MQEKEVTLLGGNVSKVTTNGEIIYKELKPQSETVHRLLMHLESKGIDFCPRYLGSDNKGREKLSFVSGTTMEDYPKCIDLPGKIMTVKAAAKLLKAYHDATADFENQQSDCWFLEYTGNLPKEVICHNDFAPYNVTFENNLPVGIIDFDTACPAPRVWDLAYAAYRFVPLGGMVYDAEMDVYRPYVKDKDCTERKVLLREFMKAYGMNADINGQIILRLGALVKLFDTECAKGNEAFIRMKAEGHQDFYTEEINFIKENYSDWQA